MNTSVGVGDRRFPTASFDSARKMSLVAMFSVCCIIICCHCCGVREELYLVCLIMKQSFVMRSGCRSVEKWVPISAEHFCKFPKGKDWGRGGSPLVSFEQASHIQKDPRYKVDQTAHKK